MPREPEDACAYIRVFVDRVRERIVAERRAPSVHVGGGLYDNIVNLMRSDSGLRKPRGTWDHIVIDKPLSDCFTLVIRDNAVFAALLPRLNAFFPCLALVRNPLSVLASWQTVELPVQRGRIPGAESFDSDLCRALDQEPETLRRQLIALEWLFARFHAHLPPENIIRYEDLVSSGGTAFFSRLGHARARPVALDSRNASALYDKKVIDDLLNALLNAGGTWTRLYSRSDCEEVAERIRNHRS